MAKYKLTAEGVQNTETKTLISNIPGNRLWKEYEDWLLEGNTPDPEFSKEELKKHKIQKIKEKASKDILDIASEVKQRNMLATILELQEKRLDGEVLTDSEELELIQAKEVWAQIKQIRKASDEEELRL